MTLSVIDTLISSRHKDFIVAYLIYGTNRPEGNCDRQSSGSDSGNHPARRNSNQVPPRVGSFTKFPFTFFGLDTPPEISLKIKACPASYSRGRGSKSSPNSDFEATFVRVLSRKRGPTLWDGALNPMETSTARPKNSWFKEIAIRCPYGMIKQRTIAPVLLRFYRTRC